MPRGDRGRGRTGRRRLPTREEVAGVAAATAGDVLSDGHDDHEHDGEAQSKCRAGDDPWDPASYDIAGATADQHDDQPHGGEQQREVDSGALIVNSGDGDINMW